MPAEEEGVESGSRGETAAGAFHLGVLDQSEVWVDERGRRFLVRDLSRREGRLLRDWLLENADWFYLPALRRELFDVARSAAPGVDLFDWASQTDPGGPDVGGGVDGRFGSRAEGSGGVPAMLFQSSQEWMASTRLFVALGGDRW